MQSDGRLLLFGAARWSESARTIHVPDSLPGYLLAYLACRADWVARESLIGLFWPERRESEALHNLRANLHRVRALLASWSAANALQTQSHRLRVELPSDVAAYRGAIGSGDWSRAVELHAEPLLAHWSWRGFALPAEWAHVERSALASSWRDAAMHAALQHEMSGHVETAAQTLLRLLEASEDPAEDAVQALLRVAAGAGRRDAALAQYERLERWLRDELGVEPMRQTEQLAGALRQPRSASIPAAAASAAIVPRAVLHPPHLIGRDCERQRLADPARMMVVVSGEPGVGKTRLLEEALPRAIWIACRDGLEQVPFAPLVEWIDDQRDSLPELGDDRRDLARLVPTLLEGEQLPPADAATAKPRLLHALARLLEARGQALVFDDLQWADAATRELIVLLARRATVPLRLAYRRDEVHDGLRALLELIDAVGSVDHLALQALGAADLMLLLAQISRADDAPALFGAWLHQRTGGNPFFALQTLRTLFETGRLSASERGWASALDDITTDYSELRIPSRVAELIRRRVLGVSHTARRVLTVIAVAGDARPIDAIAATTALSAWACAEAVAELQSAGLLHEHRFAHDLVRQSVYHNAADALRTTLHGAVARHFAAVLRDEQIAAHWWQAGHVPQALAATVRATDVQRRTGLHDDALALVAGALARVGESAERALLLTVRARIQLERGQLADAEPDALAALDEAATPHDRAEAFLILSRVRMQQGRVEDARDALEQARASDPDHERLSIELACIAQLQGRVADVIPELERRLTQLRRQTPGSELLEVLISLGGACNEVARLERSLPLLHEAYRLADRLEARYLQVEAAINLLWGLSGVGRNDEAVAIANEALALGEYDSTPTLRNNLAWSLRELGRIDEAIVLNEQLAAGRDPTLALIAQARLISMRCSSGAANGDASPMIDALLAAFDTTDIYVAHASACKAVLEHGSRVQIDRALRYLKPHIVIDLWLHRELSDAMAAHGIDPQAHLGKAADTPP